MFLSRLFKHTRARVLTALAGLTMVLGVGAAISVVTTQTQNEVVETKAGNTGVLYILDDGWEKDNGNQMYFGAWLYGAGSAAGDYFFKANYDGDLGCYKITDISTAYTTAIFLRLTKDTASQPSFPGYEKDRRQVTLGTNWNCFKYSDQTTSSITATDYGYFLVGDASSGTWGRSGCNATYRMPRTGSNIGQFEEKSLSNAQCKIYFKAADSTHDYYVTPTLGPVESGVTIKDGNYAIPATGSWNFYLYDDNGTWRTSINRFVTVTFYTYKDGAEHQEKQISKAGTTTSGYTISGAPSLTNYYGYSHTEWHTGTYNGSIWVNNTTPSTTSLKLYATYNTVAATTIYLSLTFEWEKFYPSSGSVPSITVTDTRGMTDTPAVSEVNAEYGIISFPTKDMASFTITKGDYSYTVSKNGSNNFYVMTYWDSSSSAGFAYYTYDGSATLPGYYLEGSFNGWAATSAGHFARPTNPDDRGQLMSFTMSANDECKVVQIIGPDSDSWHGYSALFSTLDGELAEGTSDASNIRTTTNATYNIYVMRETDGKMISFVNLGDAAKYGYVYVPANATLSSYSVVAMVDEETIANTTLASIANPVTTTNVSFNGTQLKRFQIFNLGGNSGRIPTSVTVGAYNIASVSKAASEASAAVYYIPTASTSSLTSVNSLAAKAVFNIGTTIASVGTHHSVCEISQSAAISLCIDYDAGKNSTYMSTATISTWDGSNTVNRGTPVYSGDPVPVELSAIRVELGNIAGGNYVIASASFIPGAPTGNESPLTLTLWIVLGCGVAGLGAIGAAYFVSKKKKRPEA